MALFARLEPTRTRFVVGVTLLVWGLSACTGGIDGGPRGGGDAELRDLRLPGRVWRLSSPQLDAEITRLFGAGAPAIGLAASADEHGITNVAANSGIDIGNASQLVDGVRTLATWVVANGPEASRCAATWGTDACLDSFLAWFPESAYRRPLSAEESTELRSLFTDLRAAYDHDYAFASLVRAVLMSPEFLYRTELGPDPVPTGLTRMTDHEIATLLSFAITDSSPDDTLRAAAAAGSLADPDERERQVRRLVASSSPVWRRFFWEWLQMDTLRSQGVEVDLPENLVAQMEEEYGAFVDDVIVENDGTLEDLFSATHSFARPELAAHYGVPHPGGELARIEFDPAQRGGLLTLGAWLVAHGKRGRDNVVRRGMNVYRDAMCNDIRPPPGVDVTAALARLVSPDASVREVVAARGSAGSCANCHRVADPVGLVFENFTSDGRWQTSYDDGRLVEPMIDLDGVGMFDNAPAVSLALTQSSPFRRCFLQRFAHFFVGRDLGSPGASTWLAETSSTFRDNGDQLEELLVALVRHPAFIERQN